MSGQPIRNHAAEVLRDYLRRNPDASRKQAIAYVRTVTHYSDQLIVKAGRSIGIWPGSRENH